MNEISQDKLLCQNRSIPWVTIIFLGLVFFLVSHRFDISTVENSLDVSNEAVKGKQVQSGSFTRQMIFPVLGIWGIFLLIFSKRNVLGINGLLGAASILYIVWSVLSIIWAELYPPLTYRRLVIFVLLSLAGAGVAKHFSTRDYVFLSLFVTIAFILIGIFAELTYGTFTPWVSGYRFIGTSNHPNTLGPNCGLAVLAAFTALHDSKSGRLFYVICVCVGFIALFLTGSRTSVAATVISLSVYWAIVLSFRRKAVLIFSALILFCFFTILFGEQFLQGIQDAVLFKRPDAVGTTATLTGRIPLWRHLLEYASERPVHGYGYAGFWTPKHISQVSISQGWTITSAHSIYIDILLSVGFVGLSTFIVILILGITKALFYARRKKSASYAFMGAVLIFITLNGILSSFIYTPIFITFLFLCVVAHLGFTIVN